MNKLQCGLTYTVSTSYQIVVLLSRHLLLILLMTAFLVRNCLIGQNPLLNPCIEISKINANTFTVNQIVALYPITKKSINSNASLDFFCCSKQKMHAQKIQEPAYHIRTSSIKLPELLTQALMQCCSVFCHICHNYFCEFQCVNLTYRLYNSNEIGTIVHIQHKYYILLNSIIIFYEKKCNRAILQGDVLN